MTTKALVVLSGGQDSTACLFAARERFDEVHAISFDYGQNHAIELVSASRIATLAEVTSHEVMNIPHGFLAGASQLTSPGSVDLFQSARELPGGIAKTFVPMRNQLFLTIAANRAYVLGCNVLVTGVCQTDSSGYPDCRESFILALEKSFNEGTFTGEDGTLGNCVIETPLMHMSKADLVKWAYHELPDAYSAWAWSHTAYTGGLPTDGDAASLLRARGFEMAGLPDPLVVRLWQSGAICDLPATENYRIGLTEQAFDLCMKFADRFPTTLI